MDSLQIAVECECEKFVSSSNVQSSLDKIWSGPVKEKIEMVIFSRIFYSFSYTDDVILYFE